MDKELKVGTPIKIHGDQSGKIIHIAPRLNHPYDDAIYLIEWPDEGELFHGYMSAKELEVK